VGADSVCDLLDLAWHILLFSEVDELLSAHLDTKVALRITAIDGDRTHAHGSDRWLVLAGRCVLDDLLRKLDALDTNTTTATGEHYPIARSQLCLNQGSVHRASRAHDGTCNLVWHALGNPARVDRG
jgi:hypothetical protein